MSPVAAVICGTIGFFVLLGILGLALYFGLSGIPAGDSRNRKDAETNAHGRREFLFDDAQDFDDEPDPKLLATLDAIREENLAAVADYWQADLAAYKREYIGIWPPQVPGQRCGERGQR